MALTFGPDFFDRLESSELEACRQKLWQARNPELGDRAEIQVWFSETWTSATEIMGLEDCAVIAKFFNIVALQEDWQQVPAWSHYVEQLLNDPYGSVPKADAVLAIHKNIIEDRVLARPGSGERQSTSGE